MERLQSTTRKIIVQTLDPRLMADGRKAIVSAGWRFGGVLVSIAVHSIEMFSLGVIGFHLFISDGPCRRYSTVMAEHGEIFFTSPEQRSAIKLGIAADVVVGMRVQVFAILVEP